MERRLRPLAPASPTDSKAGITAGLDSRASAPPQRYSRVGVPAACEQCRRRKSRCDGKRPTCDRCRNEGAECCYTTEEGETHHTALKRKYQGVIDENRQLRELFSLIHRRPAVEANEIYNRVRSSEDPLEVLELVKQADLLLPIVQPLYMVPSGLHEIQRGPQGGGFIQLPVRPWSVTPADQLVPELMGNIFLKRSILSRVLGQRLSQPANGSDAMSMDLS